jgi:uncharacterized protein
VRFTEFLLAMLTATIGAVGGLGGAVLLVPLLVLTGVAPRLAAPLGLVSVASGSLATGARQTEGGLVNHRLGIVMELFATSGVIGGALLSGRISDDAIRYCLAAAAIGAAVLGGRRKGIRNQPDPSLAPAAVGEHVGALSGVYRLDAERLVPYRAHRVGAGAGLFAAAGVLAGISGASGGFIKTPTMSEVMKVPIRVAAATTTFAVGITSAAGLIVFALGHRIDLRSAAVVSAGSLIGGRLGAALQSRLSPPAVRKVLSAVLVIVGVVMVMSV